MILNYKKVVEFILKPERQSLIISLEKAVYDLEEKA
jgi:hypothetical protein